MNRAAAVPVFYVLGPSGAGKSHLISSLRTRGTKSTFDLDYVGYRTRPDKWKEWIIPPATLSFLSKEVVPHHELFVIVGSSSNRDELLDEATRLGFTIVVVVPPVEVLRRHRRTRGDTSDKVATAEGDVEAYKALATQRGLVCVASSEEALTLIDAS